MNKLSLVILSLTLLPLRAFAQGGGVVVAGGPGAHPNLQTTNYTPTSGDCGNNVNMNGSYLTLTLPSPPPSSTCPIDVLNLNPTPLTISRNSLLVNGQALNPPLVLQYQKDHLWTDGTNWFVDQTNLAVVTYNTFYEFDDFLADGVTSPNNKLRWTQRGSGSPPQSLSGVWPHIGINSVDSGATSGNAGMLEMDQSLPFGALASNAPWDSRFIIKHLENTAETVEVGFIDTAAAAPDANNSMFVRYIQGTDTNYTFTVCQVGVCTTSASAIAGDTNWHNFRIYSVVIGEITFSADNGATVCFTAAGAGGCVGAGTVVNSSHVPTQGMTPIFYIKTSANADKHLQLDYFGFAANLVR